MDYLIIGFWLAGAAALIWVLAGLRKQPPAAEHNRTVAPFVGVALFAGTLAIGALFVARAVGF